MAWSNTFYHNIDGLLYGLTYDFIKKKHLWNRFFGNIYKRDMKGLVWRAWYEGLDMKGLVGDFYRRNNAVILLFSICVTICVTIYVTICVAICVTARHWTVYIQCSARAWMELNYLFWIINICQRKVISRIFRVPYRTRNDIATINLGGNIISRLEN